MKRRAAKLALFLLLGAIINVAVAWGCVLWRSPFTSIVGSDLFRKKSLWHDAAHYQYWRVISSCRSGACQIISSWSDPDALVTASLAWSPGETYYEPIELVPHWATLLLPPDPPATKAAGHTRIVHAHGWPMLALWSGENADNQTVNAPRDVIIVRGLVLLNVSTLAWRSRSKDIILPLGVIWPGLAINTVFYAAIVWLLFAFPFALRRRRRIKRGLCPACAYPIGDSAVCTECGAAITLRDSRKPTAESPP